MNITKEQLTKITKASSVLNTFVSNPQSWDHKPAQDLAKNAAKELDEVTGELLDEMERPKAD